MKIARLKNGDMIAGKFEEVDGISTIKNPLFIIVQPQGALFVDVLDMLSDDDNVSFKTEEIMCYINPSEEVAKQYAKRFSSIEVPSKKLII